MIHYLSSLKQQLSSCHGHLEFLTGMFSTIIGIHLILANPFEHFAHYKNLLVIGVSSKTMGSLVLVCSVLLILDLMVIRFKFKRQMLSLCLQIPGLIIFSSGWIFTLSYANIAIASTLFLIMVILYIDLILTDN